jgi:hypothetical protein
MLAAPGADTRINSGAPARTTAGTRVTAGDWALTAASPKANRQRRESQPRIDLRNGLVRIVSSIMSIMVLIELRTT